MSMRNAARRVDPLPDWDGETAFILGGGPSLRDFDTSVLAGRRVIGVNEAGLSLYPSCDILFWVDRRWADWNIVRERRIDLHTGERRVTCNSAHTEHIERLSHVSWQYMGGDGRLIGFTTRPGHVAGFDAGGRCINLAWHCGATRVVLLGFDCRDYPENRWREGNFHEAHLLPPLVNQRRDKFIPAHNAMANKIRELGLDLEVLNATPGSALECWPKVNLEDVL